MRPTSAIHHECPWCKQRTVIEAPDHKLNHIVRQCMGMCGYNERRWVSCAELKRWKNDYQWGWHRTEEKKR
jgi:hypothetical protein